MIKTTTKNKEVIPWNIMELWRIAVQGKVLGFLSILAMSEA
jgi:hypothetical protein